ncbi:CAP domain-containing protein [Roseisalinus antarcticus]|uniref:CAP domain-containing protein n=1 Tax=Roseisalinus antarcticus TaxID=254357 RepID=UPI0013564DE1|nr:CAP domain-containing protein [Roseisalinus antarcticus]
MNEPEIAAIAGVQENYSITEAIAEVDRTEFGLLLNDVRNGIGGLDVVMPHDILNRVAQDYSDDIVTSGRTIQSGDNLHVGRDGGTISDRVLGAGYDYGWVGENFAQGYDNGREVIGAWMDSTSGHREVILAPEAEDFGIGRADSTWVLIMGAER